MPHLQTTLDIDTDVLTAAERLAAHSHRTAGKVISDLVRQALSASDQGTDEDFFVNGFEVMHAGGRVITVELVEQLLEEAH